MKQQFPASVVISAYTGYLACPIGELYQILEWMTGQSPFTHQLPRFMKECKPSLQEQFPELDKIGDEHKAALQQAIRAESQDREDQFRIAGEWVVSMCEMMGLSETLDVEQLPLGAHKPTNPIEDLERMVGKDRVVAVVTPDEQQ